MSNVILTRGEYNDFGEIYISFSDEWKSFGNILWMLYLFKYFLWYFYLFKVQFMYLYTAIVKSVERSSRARDKKVVHIDIYITSVVVQKIVDNLGRYVLGAPGWHRNKYKKND